MTKDLDEERLVKKSGLRKLTVEEVGNVFTEALHSDIDGSIYLILPEMPALRVPNLNIVLFLLVPLMKIYHRLYPQTLATDAGMALVNVFLALFLCMFLLGVLFCYICMIIF